MKAPGEKPSRNRPVTAPRDPLVTELAKAESDLERIEAQRTAAKARIAALQNELATLDPSPRSVAPEPLSGLAPNTLEAIFPIIKRLAASGKTICIIEHNLDVIRGLCDIAVFLDEGRKLAEAPPETLIAEPALAQRYFG